MTENKRFEICGEGSTNIDVTTYIVEYGDGDDDCFELYESKEDSQKVCDKINNILDENEQLKEREETLLCEIEDFQELLAKNDGVCHKRVIDLIDDRISNFSNVKAELLLNSDDDYRLEKLSFAIQNLRELKKELM